MIEKINNISAIYRHPCARKILALISISAFVCFLSSCTKTKEEKVKDLKRSLCLSVTQEARAKLTGSLWREYSGLADCRFYPTNWDPKLEGKEQVTIVSRVSLKDDSPLNHIGNAPSYYSYSATVTFLDGDSSTASFEIGK